MANEIKDWQGNVIKEGNEGSFSVHSYSLIDMDNADKWVHLSKGLNMIINKNGVTIKLNEDEIKQLVKCLPRTLGGSY